jgi:acyl carrier protein
MDPEPLLRKIRAAISHELEIPVESLTDDASLREEYGLDSVAAVNIVFALETELGVEIDIRRLAGIDSIDDLKRLLSQGPPVFQGDH